MMKNLIQIFAIVVVSSALVQTAAAQNQQVEQHRDLRLEHADVPLYPDLARTARISGTVEVQVKIKDGRVVGTEVKSGPPVLARATVENIQSWRFYPLVNASFTTKFTYQLDSNEPLRPSESKSRATAALASENHRRPSHVGYEKWDSAHVYRALVCSG